MSAVIIVHPYAGIKLMRVIDIPACDADSVARAKAAQLRERLANHICIHCGAPLPPESAQPCAACVVETFAHLTGLES